jgi:hypothetical protein
MNKSVRFSEEPNLVRQLSDRRVERRQNSQTPVEQKLATNNFFMEEKEKYNTDEKTKEKYDNKEIYENTPIEKRVTDAISKGAKESAHLRSEKIAEEHRYDNWWLGGKKLKKRRTRTRKTRKTRKTMKTRKTKTRRTRKIKTKK